MPRISAEIKKQLRPRVKGVGGMAQVDASLHIGTDRVSQKIGSRLRIELATIMYWPSKFPHCLHKVKIAVVRMKAVTTLSREQLQENTVKVPFLLNVQALVSGPGHKDVRLTVRYSHLSETHLHHAVEILDKVYNTIEDEEPSGKVQGKSSRKIVTDVA